MVREIRIPLKTIQRELAMKQFRVSAFLFLLCAVAARAHFSQQKPYSWENVQIVGGGFVDGVVFHPTAPGVRYAGTDEGGAYRWNTAAHRWQPILDWMSPKDRNFMWIESSAIYPSDPNRVYLACGGYAARTYKTGRENEGYTEPKTTTNPIKTMG